MIVVVTGLPRSGTSLMMQMLEAGGVEVLTDGVRKPDEDNPRGYYEFERVKRLPEDTGWLDEAEGKAVKVVSMLLDKLPGDRNYKVIFMKRKLEEVLVSQAKMLRRLGKPYRPEDDRKLLEVFRKHLRELERWVARQKNMDVIYVSYNEIIEEPRVNAERINRFLGGGLDIDKMVSVVDKQLYRERR